MKRFLIVPQILVLSVVLSYGQMWDPDLQDTLFGNEWIDFDNPDNYYKMPVAEDGMYKITFENLPANLKTVQGANFQIFAFGKPVPFYVSNQGTLSSGDYIAFWGEKNTYQLEKHLFKSEDRILNPYYSNFNDTTAYFLTSNNQGGGLQVTEIPNDLSNLPPAESHFMREELFMLPEISIRFGDYIGSHLIEDSQFDLEGFGSKNLKTRTFDLDASEYQNTGGDASLILSYATSYNVFHNIEIYINDVLVKKDSVFGFKVFKDTIKIDQNQLTETINVHIAGIAGSSDKFSLIYADLIYPRTFNFDGERMVKLPIAPSASSRYFELNGLDVTGGQIRVWNIADQTFMNATVDNGVVKFLLPAQQSATQLIVFNPGEGVEEIANPRQISFLNFSENQGDFIFISHKKFINSPGNELSNYANYRASQEGGRFEPIIVDIEQLYEQFGYGSTRNPICIRNFLHFAEKKWTQDLKNLILVGKPREYVELRTPADVAAAQDITLFVPTFGYNASDLLLATDNYSYVPIVHLGRLAVSEPSELGNYLKKVKDYENLQRNFQNTIESKEWTKRVVHMSGGNGASERASIRSLLNSMETIIESGKMYADVTTFSKETDVINVKTQTEGLKELIDNGVSILTYFGHASSNILGFNFDDPDSYENFEKYPFLLSNGCFSGNCATGVSGIGERFISTEDKGAIGFYASSGFGFTGALFELGAEFYKKQTGTHYGKSIGEILSSCIEDLKFRQSISLQSLLQQSIYQGDPAIKIHAFDGPDYVIDKATVKLDPPFLNTELDSFKINLDLVDLGMTLPDTNFMIKIEHQLPDGSINTLTNKRIDAPNNRTSYSFNVPFLGGESAIGLNRIFINIDATNEISELPSGAESNNEFVDNFGNRGLEVYIVSNDVIPLQPARFAMIQDPKPTLMASTVSFFPEVQTYVFEIDTARNFGTNQKVRKKVQSRGGLIKWTPDLQLEDGRVYYWRVSPDSTGISGGLRWQESNFLYKSDESPGWNQSHFQQFEQNNLDLIEINPQNQKLKFIDYPRDIKLRNYIYEHPNQYPRIFQENNVLATYSGGITSQVPGGLFISVFDTTFAEPMINTGEYIFGNDLKDSAATWKAFPFKTDNEQEREEVINFLENIVPSGYYVAIMTLQRNENASYYPEDWAGDTTNLGNSIFKVLEKQGVTRIQSLADIGSVPYTCFYKKDDPDWPVQESIGDLIGVLEQNTIILGLRDTGNMVSLPVGPAVQWGELKWEVGEIDTTGYDRFNMDVFAVREDKTDSLVLEKIAPGNYDLSSISALDFPYMKIAYHAGDSLLRTPVDLKHWRIGYTPYPDLALSPQSFYLFEKDTLQQGEEFLWEMAVENISQTPVDSFYIKYRITDSRNNTRIEESFIPSGLGSGDSIHTRLALFTDTMINLQNLSVEINPARTPKEYTYINNFGQVQTFIAGDIENPLLDVTFDGERIFDGYIISAKPEISMVLRDNNPFALLNEPKLIQVEIKSPSDANYQVIDGTDPALEFIPAEDPEKANLAQLIYRPEFVEDGIYQMRVKAQDRSGNKSGTYDYEVSFEVVTETTLSHLVNYPNPFTTSTRFSYTLTGSEPVMEYKIQVLSVSGRIVRELTAADLGILMPGTRLTDGAWDGTDTYGSPLAKGVYLYRVFLPQNEGEEIERRQSQLDSYFKNDFGKMVILR
jgi:hypothetical protein